MLDVVIPAAGLGPLLSRMLGLREDVGVVLARGDPLDRASRRCLDTLGGVFLDKPFSLDAVNEAVAGATAS